MTWETITVARAEQARKLVLNPPRRTNDEHPVRKHLLSFILRCARCGGPMCGSYRRSRGRGYQIYQCRDLRGCRVSINHTIAEDVVSRFLAHRLTTPDAALLAAAREDRAEGGNLRLRLAELAEEESEAEAATMHLRLKARILENIEADRQALLSEVREVGWRLTLASLVLDPMAVRLERAKGRSAARVTRAMGGFDAVADTSSGAMHRFDTMDLHVRREIIRSLCVVSVEPAIPGVSYRPGPNGQPSRSYERIRVQPLDPRTREPMGEAFCGEPPSFVLGAPASEEGMTA
jgi:hypothetical protein